MIKCCFTYLWFFFVTIFQKISWFFWPVKQEEQSKTLPMFAVLFLVSFVYNILRTLKLTILLAEPDLPSQAISYLKIFAIMPAAIIFTWFTTKMQTALGQKGTFNWMNVLFGVLFAILTLAILPHKSFYKLSLPGQSEIITLINSWYITLFYVAAEMWSSIMLNMLCWGIIIEITKLSDSKRLYSVFSLSANLATFAAGWWGSSTIEQQIKFFTGVAQTTWEQSLLFQMIVLWIVQGLTILTFNYAMKQQATDEQRSLDKKIRVSFIDSIKVAFSHPIIRSVSLMMISYNIIYHMIDVIHNDYVKDIFSNSPKLMNQYLNVINQYLGIFAIIFSWVLSGSFVRRFGLTYSLFLTPLMWLSLSLMDLLGSTGIFSFPLIKWATVALPIHLLSLSLILSVGRAAKFTIFDTAKEMSFLGLSQQDKRLGKASVDGLTSRFGKTGGAWLVIGLVGHGGQIFAALVPLKITIFIAYGLWFYSVVTLIKQLPKETVQSE